jgi:hypothetical protein
MLFNCLFLFLVLMILRVYYLLHELCSLYISWQGDTDVFVYPLSEKSLTDSAIKYRQ